MRKNVMATTMVIMIMASLSLLVVPAKAGWVEVDSGRATRFIGIKSMTKWKVAKTETTKRQMLDQWYVKTKETLERVLEKEWQDYDYTVWHETQGLDESHLDTEEEDVGASYSTFEKQTFVHEKHECKGKEEPDEGIPEQKSNDTFYYDTELIVNSTIIDEQPDVVSHSMDIDSVEVYDNQLVYFKDFPLGDHVFTLKIVYENDTILQDSWSFTTINYISLEIPDNVRYIPVGTYTDYEINVANIAPNETTIILSMPEPPPSEWSAVFFRQVTTLPPNGSDVMTLLVSASRRVIEGEVANVTVIASTITNHTSSKHTITTAKIPVGGIWIPVDKLALLAPYIALASTILVATAATAIYVKHAKRRKKKQ